MHTRPRRLLLDADVVIKTHELGVWENLIEVVEVAVGATVVRDEALFYSKRTDAIPKDIDLPRLVHERKLTELSASVKELSQIRSVEFNISLHPGEMEALALLYSKSAGDRCFCTGDKAAIQALAMLDL